MEERARRAEATFSTVNPVRGTGLTSGKAAVVGVCL